MKKSRLIKAKPRIRSSDSMRPLIFLVGILLAFGFVGLRLFQIAYQQHKTYSQTAQAQSENISQSFTRASIYFADASGPAVLAAVNQKFPVANVVPSKIEPSRLAEVSKRLEEITGAAPDRIDKILQSKSDYSRVIDKHLDSDQAQRVKASGIPGVGVSYVTDRAYPMQSLAAEVIGFLGFNGNERSGQYGIESFYNNELVGKIEPPFRALSTDVISSLLSGLWKKDAATEVAPPDKPKDIYLTIDKNIQSFAEKVLDDVMKKWEATGGSVIVQDPISGKILAMADRPTFNPATYFSSPPENFLNRNTQEVFEPGSSIKPVTMSAGIDLNKVTPQTTYTDTGVADIAGYQIKNFDGKAHGVQTMTQVLEHSLNTGVMFVENSIGDDNFLNYLINFGFGQKTGVDLPGEVNGDISNLYSGRKINYLTASFGQGVAVTPLQLINAYSAIANGGKLMKPYVVEKIVSDGVEEVTKPEVIGIPITEKTAGKLRTMLVSVVDNGFDKARIKGYDIAGKTGTAQIPAKGGGYEENQFIHDFLGFAPAYNPKFVILLKMDRPKGITFAADSLSPAFRELAAFMINYLKIPPTRQ